MRRYLNRWETEYKRHGSIWRGESKLDIGKYLEKGRVLEVGCGNGKSLRPLVHAGYEVTGLDISKSAIASLGDCNAELIHGDIYDFRSRKKFDGIVCRYVLGALKSEDREKAVENIGKLLKKNRFVFFEDFSIGDMRFGKGERIEKNTFRRGNGIVYHYFTLQEVKRLFSGFKTIELKGSSFKRVYRGVEYTRRMISGVFTRA